MKRKDHYNDRLRHGFLALVLTVFMFAAFAGCVAGGNYGTMKFDRELDNRFTAYQVLPDHNYYITGGYGAPAAILAIHEDYQLDNSANLWVGVADVSSAQMQTWIDNLSPDVNFWEEKHFMASYILDPDGKRVGAWYSGRRTTTVLFLEDNRIKVYPPDMKPTFGGDDDKDFSPKKP